MQTEKADLIMDAKEVASHVKDGMILCVGGFLLWDHPMALVREVIKRGVKNLTVIGGASASLELDMLIGAGCAKTVVSAYHGAEQYAPVSPMFRAYAQEGKIQVYECGESTFYSGFKAAALDLPFFPDREGVGTDLPKVNPAFKEFKDPIKGEPLLAIPPMSPDVLLTYSAYCTKKGHAQPLGTGHGDRMMWIACKKHFVQAERIISLEEAAKYPERTAYMEVDGVVKAPYGAHPLGATGLYHEDAEHTREYLAAAEDYLRGGDRTKYDKYLKRYVYEPETHEDYLERIGIRRLISLHIDEPRTQR
jgi:glutaconate CoA-transferase subunit A